VLFCRQTFLVYGSAPMGPRILPFRKHLAGLTTRKVLIFVSLGLVSCLILVTLYQRASSKSKNPSQLLAEADRLAWLSNWPRAGDLYAQAEHLAIKRGDKRDQLYATCGRLRANIGLESVFQASTELTQILEDPVAANDSRLRIRCLASEGDIERDDHADSAYRAWHEVLKLAQGLDDKQWQARARAELAIIDFMDGNADKAANLLSAALTSSFARADFPTLVIYGSQVGNGLVELGRADEALEYCNATLHIASMVKDMGFPYAAYGCKARALGLLGKTDEARKLLLQTLDETRELHMPLEQSQVLISLGHVSEEAGDRRTAIQYFEQAGTLSQANGFNHSIAWSMYEAAKVYRDEGRYADADRCETQAMKAMRQVGDEYHLPLHLAVLADLKAREGELAEAHELYDQASDLTESLLLNTTNEEEKNSLIATMSDVYKGDFALTAHLGHTAEAFRVIETARGRSIADLMRQPQAREGKLSDAQKTEQTEISRIQRTLMETTDHAERKELLDKLFLDEQFMDARTQPANAMQDATLRSKPVDLSKLQSVLLPEEAVLEYVLAEPKSFCLVIDRRRAVIIPLPAGEHDIEKATARYLGQIEVGKRDDEDAKKLYDFLLAPVPQLPQITRLTIVPDASLWNLPIETLRGPDEKYVLQSHTVSYAPSSTVLYYLRTRRPPVQPQMAFLGIGDVPYDLEPKNTGTEHGVLRFVSRGLYDLSGTHLYALPETRQELISASQALGQPKETTLLLGDKATETEFKSEPLSEFKIIHFAVHGVSVPDFPNRDALILGRDLNSNDDGLLQVREIARLSLDADLVTLSACNTGTGKVEGEEGSTGLVQAFLFAGARTVAASLWPVDDASTELIMKQFYTHLEQKQDEASALRQAKLDYLKSKGDMSPIFWAPFVIVGDASKPVSF
jgi:CHAT domain-containing protein